MTKPPTITARQNVAITARVAARPRPIRASCAPPRSRLYKTAEPRRSQIHPGISTNAMPCSRDVGEIQIVLDCHDTRLSTAATVIIPSPATPMIRSSTPAMRDLSRHCRSDSRAFDDTTPHHLALVVARATAHTAIDAEEVPFYCTR